MEYLSLGSLDNYVREHEKSLKHTDLFSMARGAAAGMKVQKKLVKIYKILQVFGGA